MEVAVAWRVLVTVLVEPAVVVVVVVVDGGIERHSHADDRSEPGV